MIVENPSFASLSINQGAIEPQATDNNLSEMMAVEELGQVGNWIIADMQRYIPKLKKNRTIVGVDNE